MHEQVVDPDAFVRVIDAFVDILDLKSFGFSHIDTHEEGRPPYHPGVLLKLYLYGYHYGIRSSRKLEREARLNMEVNWLLHGQHPKNRTISEFRKIHPKAFKKVFRRFVYLLKQWDFIEGETIAIDSFKIRACNSLKNNFNERKLNQHIEYIDNKIAEYEDALNEAEDEEKQEIEIKIEQKNQQKEKYQNVRQQLSEQNQEQISLTDPDARAVVLHRNIVNVGYNIQASVDAKHKLLVECDTGDVNDTLALAPVAIATKKLLKVESMNALADKGYHTGDQLKKCDDYNITCYVSPKAPATKDIGLYPVTDFIYDYSTDSYTCPAGNTMTSNGRFYTHSSKGKITPYKFKRYQTPACKTCTIRKKCTTSERNGRCIDRSEYADTIELNHKRVSENPDYYRLRQQIAEHMFGTFKRQRGFTYTLMKGKENVLSEVRLVFLTYNLGRTACILGVRELVERLKDLISLDLDKIRNILSRFYNANLKILENRNRLTIPLKWLQMGIFRKYALNLI
jgi:transposase